MALVEGSIPATLAVALLLVVLNMIVYAVLQYTTGRGAHYYWEEVGKWVLLFAAAIAGVNLPLIISQAPAT